MSITKINTPELLDFPNDSTSSANTSGTVIPVGVTNPSSLEYLVVAGGGGTTNYNGGGGGAGGLLNASIVMNDSITYSITIGEGGAATNNTDPLTSTNDGDDSTLNGSDITLITATGGGRGGLRGTNSNNAGGDGGSGGGGGSIGSGGNVAGSGNTPSTTPSQGNDGGVGADLGAYRGGGGGGAGAAGGSSGSGGNGGVGLDMSSVINSTNATSASVGEVSGSGVYFAGGGGAGANSSPGSGGLGGGGDGGTSSPAGQGTEGTGGGGGGGSYPPALNAAKGGRGVVILRYYASRTATTSGFTAEAGPYTEGDYKVLVLKQGTGTVVFSGTPTNVRSTTNLNAGEFRFNTTTGYVEYYDGSTWLQIADEYITGQPTVCICNYPTSSVALYQFEDNTNDTCGGSAGTLYGTPTYVTGNFGKAIDFNGTNQGVTLPSILPANSSSSSSATVWFKTSDTTGAQQTLIESWDGTTGSNGAWAVWKDLGNVLRLGNYYLDGNNVGTDGTINVADGNWHFIAVVFDYSGGTLSLYLDGNSTPEIQFTGLTPGTVNIFSGSGALGYQIQGGNIRYFPGSMDQFRVFPIALSQTQITELYNEVVCK